MKRTRGWRQNAGSTAEWQKRRVALGEAVRAGYMGATRLENAETNARLEAFFARRRLTWKEAAEKILGSNYDREIAHQSAGD